MTRIEIAVEALKKIESRYHLDRTCSLEAQGYSQIDCAIIGAQDDLACIARNALIAIGEAIQGVACPVRLYEPDRGPGTHNSEFWIKDNTGRVVASCCRKADATTICEAINERI